MTRPTDKVTSFQISAPKANHTSGIFAIQKCNPVPFYLFDEINAALNTMHRKAIANMIQANTGQWRPSVKICTYSTKLGKSTDSQFYGYKFRNKVFCVECVTREDAYDFVEDNTTYR